MSGSVSVYLDRMCKRSSYNNVCVHCVRNGIGTWVRLPGEEGEEPSPRPLASWDRAYMRGFLGALALGLDLAALEAKAPSIQYIITILAPAGGAMGIVSSRAEIFLFESRLFLAAGAVVMVFCRGRFLSSFLVVIRAAIFLTTYPTPRPSTSVPHVEFVPEIHAARKDVITCPVLQTPPLTPRTLFRVGRAGFSWISGGHSAYLLKTV